MKLRWVSGHLSYYYVTIDRYIPYYVPVLSYRVLWRQWTPWGTYNVGIWYISCFEKKYYHFRYTAKIYYWVPGQFELYADYVREPDPGDIDKLKYGINMVVQTGTLYVGVGAVLNAQSLRVGGASIWSIIKAADKGSLLFGMGDAISNVLGFFDYTNPDPNPTGAGEGYINTIDPSWEPYLTN